MSCRLQLAYQELSSQIEPNIPAKYSKMFTSSWKIWVWQNKWDFRTFDTELVVIYCLLIWKHLSINNVVASCVHNLRYWTKKGRTVIYSSPRTCFSFDSILQHSAQYTYQVVAGFLQLWSNTLESQWRNSGWKGHLFLFENLSVHVLLTNRTTPVKMLVWPSKLASSQCESKLRPADKCETWWQSFHMVIKFPGNTKS